MFCNKIPYPTIEEAQKNALILLNKKDQKLREYKCSKCGNYHLTKYSKKEWKVKETNRRMGGSPKDWFERSKTLNDEKE